MALLILDSEAVASLARPNSRRYKHARSALEAVRRLGGEAVVPAVILAELYRGGGHNQVVDGWLSREGGVIVRETDRYFARLVGGVLAATKSGSDCLADAHTVAAVVERGGGVILTGDRRDIKLLASPYPNVRVEQI